MTVCFFGNYIRDYPRVVVMRKGLQKNGVKVLECHTRKRGFLKYWDLYRQHQKLNSQYDALLVAMGGQTLVWFAKLLTSQKLVFDAFVSLYLTNVEDRRLCTPGSLKASYYAFWDRISCQQADLVLLDTNAQIDYFVQNYRLPKEKFVRILVGADDEIFFPQVHKSVPKKDEFIVHWHGHIVPFHGLQTILEAAQRLLGEPAIKFEIITRFTSKYEPLKELAGKLGLTNVVFLPETDYQGLAEAINDADVGLGVFGDNQKAKTVIPNKLYETIACEKPLITGRQKVVGELFSEQKNVMLCNPEDSADLAEKILWAKNHLSESQGIARAGYLLFRNQLTPTIIGQTLKNVLF